MRGACVLVAAAAGALLAASAQAAPRLDTGEAVQRELNAIFKLPDNVAAKTYDARIQAVVNAPGFSQIEPRNQCVAWWLAGIGRGQLADWKAADGYYVKAVACPDMPRELWSSAFDAALRMEDWDAAVTALQTLAEHWPAELSTYDDDAVFRTIAGARKLEKGGERRYALLDALYDSGWKPSDPSNTLDRPWADLAAGLVDRGLTIRAGRVVQGISDPWVLALMKADKRFDGIYDHADPRFDPEKQAPVELEFRRKLVADHPDRLSYVIDYSEDLIIHLQPEAALKLLDEAQARIDHADPKAKPPYTDLEEKAVWVKDYRRRALSELGRADEALALELAASKDKERGGDNVSQIINLAHIYVAAGRPQEALATLGQLKSATSPYGRMMVEKVKVLAAAQTGDKATMDASLAYMKAHELDAPGAVIVALLAAKDLDAVARTYIERLSDPDRRLDALGAFQDFATALHPSALEQMFDNGMTAMAARPDVKAALAAVGRTSRYSFRDSSG